MRNTKWFAVAFALATLFGTATCGDLEPQYAQDLFECNPDGDGPDCPDKMTCFYRRDGDDRPRQDPENTGVCCLDENCGRTVKVDDKTNEKLNR
jgi:hypothetical protein